MKKKCFVSISAYGRTAARKTSAAALLAVVCALPHTTATAQSQRATAADGAAPILEAKEAFQRRDRGRLASLRSATANSQNPLAMWAAYWDMAARLPELQPAEVDDFYKRWQGTYVEDRLRNDWLLELGRRRDWGRLAADFPRFRMNDDKQVTCYALITDQLAGKGGDAERRQAGLAAWLAQRDADDGCALMAATLFEAKLLTPADVWRKARFAIDANKPGAVRQAVALLGVDAVQGAQVLLDSPARYLSVSQAGGNRGRTGAELATLALMRMAADDPDNAARLLEDRWEAALPPDLASWAWAMVGKQTAMKLLPRAVDHYERAARLSAKGRGASPERRDELEWPDETLAWKVRAALRGVEGKSQWAQVQRAIDSMSPQEQRDPTWVYWKARALQVLSRNPSLPAPAAGDMQLQAQGMLESIAGQLHFYGKLATEELGRPLTLPPKPAPLRDEELAEAKQSLGLRRSLVLIATGLRGEGVREWNFTLRGMDDRQLLAAAQLACDQQVWDRCINTSDRTKAEVDLTQRFPMPFRQQVVARASAIGLDAAYVYGLIRQESRFIMDARSHVGASGLMQVMPATARWTAKRLGVPYTADLITDRDTNIAIGTGYLKLVLDDLEGSQPMAAAAYNAGPGRPRRWREGPQLEPAIWAENIPFAETRDYVKKVMSNATYYAALLTENASVAPSLKARLGTSIGPRDLRATAPNKELP